MAKKPVINEEVQEESIVQEVDERDTKIHELTESVERLEKLNGTLQEEIENLKRQPKAVVSDSPSLPLYIHHEVINYLTKGHTRNQILNICSKRHPGCTEAVRRFLCM